MRWLRRHGWPGGRSSSDVLKARPRSVRGRFRQAERPDRDDGGASQFGQRRGQMELRHLRYFVAVAEELHFSRAAARLHIARPAVSEQVRKLEEELGVRLLNRTQRTVSFTDAGTALLPEARRVLQQVE